MRNIHRRVFDHPIALVRSWISLAWSDSQQDIFPRDVIKSWRANPDGSTGLIPGTTLLGHGSFVFTLAWWDGVFWRADLDRGAGYQQFHLARERGTTKVTHTLEAKLPLAVRLAVIPIHDWVIEATFDRLEVALATGKVPRETLRPMGFVARQMFAGLARKRASRNLLLAR